MALLKHGSGRPHSLTTRLLRHRQGGTPSGGFDLATITFTPNMAKRIGPSGIFDAAPIVQGYRTATGNQDYLQSETMAVLGNPTDYVRNLVDMYQGTVGLLFTPEWDGNDGQAYYLWAPSGNYLLRKTAANNLEFFVEGQTVSTSTAAWTAGTTYLIVARWDTKRPIDDSGNYLALSVNNSHTYGGFQPTVASIFTNMRLGCYYSPHANPAANGIVEGMFVSRRVLVDSNGHGTPPVRSMFGSDDLTDLYNAGTFRDAARIFGGWDCTFFMPTDCDNAVSTATLTSGDGEAWSMCHNASLPDVTFMSDGSPPGTPYAVELNGTSTYVNGGSGATIDDIPSGAEITVSIWVRMESDGGQVINKGSAGADGWALYTLASSGVRFYVTLATTDVIITSYDDADLRDGKWHHLAAHYDDATKTGRVAVDGRWSAADVGAGAYQSDAARSLLVGCHSGIGGFMEGGAAWWEVWDNDHFGAGTDFVPPRAPTAAGPANLIETWWADEGTGATVAARVTTPGNDGTITAGTWSRIWEQESTPVIPQSLESDGGTTNVNCGSAAALDDIPSGGSFTAEVWLRMDLSSSATCLILSKSSAGAGWNLYWNGTSMVSEIRCATSAAAVSYAFTPDGVWHHWAITYNDVGDRKARLYKDGVHVAISAAAVGAYQSDAADFFFIGLGGDIVGGLSFVRLSDNLRYSGSVIGQASFEPPNRGTPPATDGNTVVQYNFTDGAGTTLTDAVGANNGTITLGTGQWWNTTDMEYDSPAERVYPWGYAFGTDAAGEGITIIEDATVIAGKSYVVRASISAGQSGGAWPHILVYDNIGAANIVDFYGPRYIGQHTGANNAASLTDSNARWAQDLTGWVIHNATDSSNATITSNTEQNIVGALAGGVDNDWDTNDWYILRPPSNGNYSRYPWQETFVFTAPAGCSSIDVKVLSNTDGGIVHVHQVEVYDSRIANGDHESLQGVNPELPTGWVNDNLDPGDTAAEAVVVHAGAQSIAWAVGASVEYMHYDMAALAEGNYVMYGMWSLTGGSASLYHGPGWYPQAHRHNDASEWTISGHTHTTWVESVGVNRRGDGATWASYMYASPGASGTRYSDDVYCVLMNSVSLFATPASQAASLESGGIRCDGMDRIQLPAGPWFDREGSFRWRVIVRQYLLNADELLGYNGILLELRYDAGNYVYLVERVLAGQPIYVGYRAAGAALVNASWYPGAAWQPGDNILLRFDYGAFGVRLWADGVIVMTSAVPCRLDAAPTVRQIGSGTTTWFGTSPDIVIAAP